LFDPQVVQQPIAESHKWLGDTIGFWVQDAILFVSAIAGLAIIFFRGNQEARRATIELLVEHKQEESTTRNPTLKGLHDKGITNFAQFVGQPASEEYKTIIFALNSHEFIASGIRTKALSEEIYKRMRYSAVVRDWESLQGFIAEFRKAKSKYTLFQDFEWLYDRWKKNPLKRDKK
jgi:Domain of unknown function (DUF4760)